MRKSYRGPRPGEILAWADAHGIDRKTEEHKSGPHLRLSPAPCCAYQKRGGSLAIHTGTGLWVCFACQTKGNWPMLARAFGHPLPDPYEGDEAWQAAPIESKTRRAVTGGHYPDLLQFCTERGFSFATLDAWRVSTCGPKALRWPIYGWIDGAWRVINTRIRRVIDRESAETADWFEIKGGPKTAIGNHLLGRDPDCWRKTRPAFASDWLGSVTLGSAPQNEMPGFLTAVKRILITEGQWDAMTAYQLGIPALSLPNGASAVHVQNLLRYVPEGAEVWLALDMDDAGNRAAEAFYARLGTSIKRLHLPHKDLNAWLMADPSLTAETVLSATKAKPAKTRRSLADLDASVIAPSETIMTLPWSRLTMRLDGGLKAAQVTSLLAPSGVGKTTVANEIIAHGALSMVKVGVIQLEGARGEIITSLKAQYFGRAEAQHIDEDDAKARLKNIVLSDIEGKAISCSQTVDEIKELAEEGCKLIVMDNWDYITGDTETGQRDKAHAFGSVQTIAKQYGCHIIAVWQPRKVNRSDMVNSGQQKGLSTCLQDSDIYLTLNKHGLLRRIDVEKARVKERENISSTIWLKYDTEKNTMFEIDSPAELKLLDDVEDNNKP